MCLFDMRCATLTLLPVRGSSRSPAGNVVARDVNLPVRVTGAGSMDYGCDIECRAPLSATRYRLT